MSGKPKCVLILAASVFCLAHMSFATTRFVATNGLNVFPFTNWASAATRIQAAIDASGAGDIVLLTNGTYYESGIMVSNVAQITSVGGAGYTVLDAQGNSGCLLMRHSGTCSIERLTLMNGLYGRGGGIGLSAGYSLYARKLTIDHCVLLNCRASDLGGGGIMFHPDRATHGFSSELFVQNCRFENCSAGGSGYGGAILIGEYYPQNTATVIVESCVFTGNQADAHGGCLAYGAYGTVAKVAVRNSQFKNNRAAGSGGAIWSWGFNADIQNCYLSGNSAGANGGGVDVGYAVLRNCTLIHNTANGAGGGINGGTALNSIAFYNHARGYGQEYNGCNFAYSCSYPEAVGAGNITNAPGLAGLANPHLVMASPCANAGSVAYAQGNYDIDGEPRLWGAGVDMGCDEFYTPGMTGALVVAMIPAYTRAVAGFPIQFEARIEGKAVGYVWNWGDGTLSSNAPLDSHAFGAPGVYDVVLTAWNNTRSVSATNPVYIFSGYTNYVSLSGAHVTPFTNWMQAATTLQAAADANIPGGVIVVTDGVYNAGGAVVVGGLTNRIALTNAIAVRSVNGPAATRIQGGRPLGNSAARCAYVGAGASLSGLTLADGATRSDWTQPEDQLCGGGAWCAPGALMSNCVVEGNDACFDGGGLRGGRILNSQVIGNLAGRTGGGISLGTAECVSVAGNVAFADGGGAGGGALARCYIFGNAAADEGGGTADAALANCLVYGNEANYGGGAARSDVLQCTLAANHAFLSGGGTHWCLAQNSIVYFNAADASWPNYFNTICDHACTFPDPEATGCITNDPLFVNLAGGDFRLRRPSPCVDTGASNSLADDLLGVPRPLDGHGDGLAGYDMGAYERPATYYVAQSGAHIWPFLTWAGAAADIQSAVDAAGEGDLVLVSNGVYVTGGRTAAGGGLTNRLVVGKALTVRSMNGARATAIAGAGPSGPAAVRVVWLGSNAVLSGFTITNGYTRTLGDAVLDQSGGGLFCSDHSTVSQCVVAGNAAQAEGGGAYRGRLVNCLIVGNRAASSGGGVARSALDHCSVAQNTAAAGSGGGAYLADVRRSVIYNNTGVVGSNYLGGSFTASCLAPLAAGTGNIAQNPQFLSLAAGDFRLRTASPCVDALTNSAAAVDLDAIPRPLDGKNSGLAKWDMGCHETIHNLADTDRDGLTDSNELALIHTSPILPDSDSDLQSDGDEVVAASDPLNASSYFTVASMAANEALAPVLSWTGALGRLYSVQTATNLARAWTNAQGFAEVSGWTGLMSYTASTAAARNQYRVKVRLAP